MILLLERILSLKLDGSDAKLSFAPQLIQECVIGGDEFSHTRHYPATRL